MKLEIGSGYSPTPGYLHLDANPNAPHVDVVGLGYPLPDEVRHDCFDEVRAVDVLEHLSYRDTIDALTGWAAVLVPGGRLYVQVPDAETIMQWYVERPSRLVRGIPAELPRTPLAGAAWRLLGGHGDGCFVREGDDWRWNAHYALFSPTSLTAALRTVGLAVDDVHVNAHPNICAWATKP